jgi:microcystin-dependent protein
VDNLPAGTILLYCGHLEDLPDGWVLCDGRQVEGDDTAPVRRTPDLRGRVPRGMADPRDSGEVGRSGGKAQIVHSHAMPHTHIAVTLPPERCAESMAAPATVDSSAGPRCGESHVHSVPTSGPVQGAQTEDARIQVNPPHVKLLFVVKVR